MKASNHRDIVKLSEVTGNRRRVCLIMEHLSGGNISNYLEDHYPMTEKEARSTFHQLVSPVQHSHQSGNGPQGPEAKNMLTDAHRNAKMADQEPHSGQYNLWNTIGEDGKVCVWVGGIGPTHPEQYRNGCQSHQSAGLLQRLGLSTQFLGNRLHMLAVPSLMLPQNCFWAQNMADLWLMNGA